MKYDTNYKPQFRIPWTKLCPSCKDILERRHKDYHRMLMRVINQECRERKRAEKKANSLKTTKSTETAPV